MTDKEGARPVSFVLLAFNQERFVAEAVMSALLQDYSPLEIVLSDDSSTDQTYEIMKELASGYVGKHRVIVRQTSRTLGIGAHVNDVVAVTSGDFIVVGAGDDISDSSRVSRLFEFWQQSGCPSALSSQVRIIDESGNEISSRYSHYDKFFPQNCPDSKLEALSLFVRFSQGNLLGCASAWSRTIFTTFGPLNEDVVHEDNAVAFRAGLLDRVAYLDMALVSYRIHSSNMALRESRGLRAPEDFSALEKSQAERENRRLAHLRQHFSDLQCALASGIIPLHWSEQLRCFIEEAYWKKETRTLWWSSSVSFRLKRIARAISKRDLETILWAVPRTSGLGTYAAGRALLGRLSRTFRLRGAWRLVKNSRSRFAKSLRGSHRG